MKKTLRLVLGDQLSRNISALDGIDPRNDAVVLVEVHDETVYVRHHKQKIVLVLAAMRHFAESLRDRGIFVDYVRLDDPNNTGSFSGELARAVDRLDAARIVATEPGEWRVLEMMQRWEKDFGIPVEIREDRRFLCPKDEFEKWAEGKKQLRMEYFYRHMRKKTGWLMDDKTPVGGRWNYDVENRKTLREDVTVPMRRGFKPDKITREVIELVGRRFADHFGELEPFRWAVTREKALERLRHFISQCLPYFGDYQDAMKEGEDFVFHSLVSAYLNIGLLTPKEVCEAALSAYRGGDAPLAAVEGFIRQILGWREYVRGIYWMKMPAYATTNFFGADRPLPSFYWTGDTDMNCLRETIRATRANAYAHHIQRLMITGNFALLAGVAPAEVEEWYLIVYADAFEWVELPNTHGMALFADSGLLASKPYAASGAYIDRMSDYCGGCAYDAKEKLGEKACPFNYLYWYFMITNERKLAGNPRMGIAYRTLSRMSDERRRKIRLQAERFLKSLQDR